MPTTTAAILRLRYIASTNTQADAICGELASALRLSTSQFSSSSSSSSSFSSSSSSGSSSSCLHLGNALLEITTLPPWLTLARHSAMLKRPHVARLRGIDVFTNSTSTDVKTSAPSSSSYNDARAWLSEDRPIVTPTVGTVPLSNSVSLASTICPQVREIVLGAGANCAELASIITHELDALPCPGLPHVYALHGGMMSISAGNKVPSNTNSSIDAPDFLKEPQSHQQKHQHHHPQQQQQQQQQHSSTPLQRNSIALRLLHSPMSALVLQVEAGGLAAAKEDLWHRGVKFEEIGSTGAAEGQILLSSPHLRGLDVRICDGGAALSPFFNEGDEVLREHVLEELNPAISQSLAAVGEGWKQASSPAAAYRRMGTGMGDCWSEFRSQLKRPGGFLASSSSSSLGSSSK